jgi:DNA repair protein RecO (recombination protein O)
MINGARSPKSKLHASHFEILNLIEIAYTFRENKSLQRMTDVKLNGILNGIRENEYKSASGWLIAELLTKSIREHEPNQALYLFAEQTISELNTLDFHPEFHLIFMLKLSAYLGFEPVNNFSESQTVFDLMEGQFVNYACFPSGNLLSAEDSKLLKLLLDAGENPKQNLLQNRGERQKILQALIRYFQFHLEGFGQLKSPDVLNSIMS